MTVNIPPLAQQIFDIESEILNKSAVKYAQDSFSQALEDLLSQMRFPNIDASVNVLIRYFFDSEKMISLTGNRSLLGNFDSRFVTNLILKRQGYCYELSLLFLMLAQGLSIPCYGVVFPMKHMFIGIGNEEEHKYIELTRSGRFEVFPYIEKLTRRYSKVYKINPVICDADQKVISAYCTLVGHLLYLQGQVDKAKLCLEKAIELDENFPRNHHVLAWVFYKLGKKDLAVQALERELEIDPDFIHASLYMAYILSDDQKVKKIIDQAARKLR